MRLGPLEDHVRAECLFHISLQASQPLPTWGRNPRQDADSRKRLCAHEIQWALRPDGAFLRYKQDGATLFGGPPNPTGYDPGGLSILVHVGPDLTATTFLFSGASGEGRFPLPIPNNPIYLGFQFATQTLWVSSIADGTSCSTSPIGLETSVGLDITVQ